MTAANDQLLIFYTGMIQNQMVRINRMNSGLHHLLGYLTKVAHKNLNLKLIWVKYTKNTEYR